MTEALHLKRASSPEFPNGAIYQFENDDGVWVSRVVLTKNRLMPGYNLRALETLPKWRGKGLAKKLLTKILDVYKKEDIFLDVEPFRDEPMNEHALRAFYISIGFRSMPASGMVRPGIQS